MAEAQEDIIIIEDSDAAGSEINEDVIVNEDNQPNNKKIIILGGVIGLLIVIIFIVLYFVLKPKEVEEIDYINAIDSKLDEKVQEVIEPSKIEKMIAKANYLYSNGSKDEALFLYEKIALYSEAISIYNLGVAQLKDKEYAIALETFKKAILNDEKRCVSAINAAVCSLHLNNQKDFNYYINLAYAYLANEQESPLYSYYYALINYYKHNYLEALSALENPTSDEYSVVQKHLRAKINALFGNDYKAIEAMEQNLDYEDSFSIALLYARIGDLVLAQSHLVDAITKNIQPVKSAIAQAIINLKMGRIQSAAKGIKNVTDMFPDEVYKPYPISVRLKESLFEPLKAQLRYRDNVDRSKTLNYQKIFYFAPYKMFNADQTISYIQKGNANIYINNTSSAKNYLSRSASSSSVNKGIAKAIRKALAFKLREANDRLNKLVLKQPKHSILHYNLALTYAQMGNMTKAYKHFVRSFNLDAKNYLSGVFAIMSAQLINKNVKHLENILKDSIALEETDKDVELYKVMIAITDNNIISTSDWLDTEHNQKPLSLALESLVALSLNKIEMAKKASYKLTLLLPNEILPHMMYIDAHFSDFKPKKYAKKVLNYLKLQKFDFDDLYYGPYITRYLYTQQNLITGKLFFLREQLRDVLETTSKNTQEITSALALASLYDKAFEESYTLYNYLIDELKVRDAYTLFLGAVASTAASHHANAIALLELSKMKNGSLLESRYALGLLYLEIMNNQGAVIQFGKIGDNGFSSSFFNFDIDLDKLLFEKQQKNTTF